VGQVNGRVREWQDCHVQAKEGALMSPSPKHQRMHAQSALPAWRLLRFLILTGREENQKSEHISDPEDSHPCITRNLRNTGHTSEREIWALLGAQSQPGVEPFNDQAAHPIA
jgi:hypothetical protein